MDYKRAQTYWKDKEPASPRMDPDALRGRIEEYMQSRPDLAPDYYTADKMVLSL